MDNAACHKHGAKDSSGNFVTSCEHPLALLRTADHKHIICDKCTTHWHNCPDSTMVLLDSITDVFVSLEERLAEVERKLTHARRAKK